MPEQERLYYNTKIPSGHTFRESAKPGRILASAQRNGEQWKSRGGRALASGIGGFLRELRAARQMSLEQVAARASVAVSTLSRWETGAYRPRLPELQAVLVALDTSPEQRELALHLVDAPRALRHLRAEAEELAFGQGHDPLLLPCSGELLRALRKRCGLSMEEVARQLGVRINSVSRWENSEAAPPPERQTALLDLLRAEPEERAALIAGRLLFTPRQDTPDSSADALECRLTQLAEQAQQGEHALMDLRFLTLEADLAALAQRRPTARRLLALAYTWHAQWLSWWDRYTEVGRYAARALDLLGEIAPQADFWIRAVHASGVSAVCRGTQENPRRGLETLRGWLPLAAHPQQATWLYRDMADYASRAGQSAAALDLIGYARADAERTEDPDLIHLSKYVHADILVKSGRPAEAIPLLEAGQILSPFQNVLDRLKSAEALLAVGSRAAQEHLQHAYALIRRHQMTNYQGGADRLARQLSGI